LKFCLLHFAFLISMVRLLAIDIGNTNISLGVFRGQRLLQRYRLPTQGGSYAACLRRVIRCQNIKAAAICSVAPQAAGRIAAALKQSGGVTAYYIGKQLKVPLKNRCRYPRKVGQDRLINAYAGVKLYGAPLLVVDFGTGVTFDAVSARGEYLGGAILPGLQLLLSALARGTALLPKIKLSAPGELIGRDTRAAMLSGAVYGFAALAEGLAEKMKKKIGSHSRVIATGGNAKLIAKYCRAFDKVDPDLTLKGISMLYAAQIQGGVRWANS
jgi:type III pantothenate kinase